MRFEPRMELLEREKESEREFFWWESLYSVRDPSTFP